MAAPAPPAPQIPKIVYAVFCGGIEQATAQKIVNSLTIAMGGKVEHVHLLFQSAGGYVGDGVFLYNFFRSITIEVTLYKCRSDFLGRGRRLLGRQKQENLPWRHRHDPSEHK
jgi:hypothetical protein